MSDSPIHTSLCDMLGIEVPILSAGMAYAAGVELTVAVSNAGGLGVLGCTGFTGDKVRKMIREVREKTDKPFGVDIILPPRVSHESFSPGQLADLIPPEHAKYREELRKHFDLPESVPEGVDLDTELTVLGTGVEEQIEIILEEKVPVFVSGLGSPGFMIERARAQGMKVFAIVGNVKAARRVASDGVDAVVAQGYDGGGHTGRVGTFSLIPQVIDALSPLPILAAGGVTDGRGLAASIAFGCVGVWVGTRFLASKEASIEDWKKDRIVAANEEATVRSRAYTGKPARVLKNEWTEAWEKGDLEPLPLPLQPALIGEMLSWVPGDERVSANAAGQGLGLIKDIPSAGDIVRQMAEDAERILLGHQGAKA